MISLHAARVADRACARLSWEAETVGGGGGLLVVCWVLVFFFFLGVSKRLAQLLLLPSGPCFEFEVDFFFFCYYFFSSLKGNWL